MSDKPMTREELLEAALRVALRQLGGRIYTMRSNSHLPRPAEGQLVIEFRQGRLEAELPGHLTPEECLRILCAMDDGSDPIVAADDWHEVYAGNVRYRSAAGHVVEVFNDCDSWDYVDTIRHADGRTWDFEDDCTTLGHHPNAPGDWMPDEPKRWGLHGKLSVPPIEEPRHG